MEYHEAVNTLERLRRLRPKLGTDTTASLLAHLGDPHEGVPAVQVAGSNGKGSTARVLAQILEEAGLTVGLYTSPDLNDLRERVRVDGRKVPKPEVVRYVEEAWPYVVERSVEGDAPTFFEAFTAFALWHFGREDVDVAVLEVGIGGRYDATSVVDPVAAAVTSVSLEHTDLLGETVEEIARDKAHVAPADGPLVTGTTGAALETVRERTSVLTVGTGDAGMDGSRADETAPDVLATEGEMVSFAESAVSLVGPDWAVETRSPLLGRHQALNAGIAAALARQVGTATGTPVTEDAIAAGVRNARWPGRFEVMERSPLVVLDGAHNPDACSKLAALLDRFDYGDLHLVFGAMRDKDHAAMCRALPPADRVHLAEPAVDRALNVDTLTAVFERETDAGIDRHGSVPDALDGALRAAGPADCVLVAGSLYTVGEARDRWTRAPRAVRTDTSARARAALERADVPAERRAERADRITDRTVLLHARRGEAADLREEMLSLGGTAAVSGITTADEHVEVVLDGSLETFRRLVGRLRERGGGDAHIGGQVAEALGFDSWAPAEDRALPWESRAEETAVVGVVDVDPDAAEPVEAAVARGREAAESGAAVLEVGASTEPGADPPAAEAERERVATVAGRLSGKGTTVAARTRRPSVAGAALDAGAAAVVDRTGLADAEMRRLVADRDVPVVLCHDPGPRSGADRAGGHDAIGDAIGTIIERLLLGDRAGVDRSRVLVAPGLGADAPGGFPDRLPEFWGLGCRVLVDVAGSMPGGPRGESVDRSSRAAATALAVERGADAVRVRDVAGAVAAVATAERTLPGE